MSTRRKKPGGNPKGRARVAPLGPSVTPLGISFPSAPPDRALAIESNAAPELVDLASIFGDLLTASMAAHHVNEPSIKGSGLVFLRRACWEAAIIAYGRCFHDGQGAAGRKRATLHGYVDDLHPDLRTTHDQVLALRDKRIGHHVASDSGQKISLRLDVASGDPGVLTLNDIYVSVESELYDECLLSQLETLTMALRERVGARIDELRLELRAAAIVDPHGLQLALTAGCPWAPPVAPPMIDGVVSHPPAESGTTS